MADQANRIAVAWGVDADLLRELEWELLPYEGNDGEIYGYYVEFPADSDQDDLEELGIQPGNFRRDVSIAAFEGADITDLPREMQIRTMVDWFFTHFEDPAHRTPYETAEGGYQWIWGGPHDATEELENQFGGAVDFEDIVAAVSEIESDGLTEWAPVPSSEDYDPPEAEGDEDRDDPRYNYLTDDFGNRLTDDAGNRLVVEKTAEQLQAEIAEDLRAIDEVVEQLKGIAHRTHNNPPEYLDELPDLEPVTVTVQATRELIAQPSPPPAALVQQASAFRKIADLLKSPLAVVGEVFFSGIAYDALKHDYTALKTLYGAAISIADKLTAFSDIMQGLI